MTADDRASSEWKRKYTVFVCVGCKEEFPEEPMWLEHIQHCEKHPMHAKEMVIAKLQEEIDQLKREVHRLGKKKI